MSRLSAEIAVNVADDRRSINPTRSSLMLRLSTKTYAIFDDVYDGLRPRLSRWKKKLTSTVGREVFIKFSLSLQRKSCAGFKARGSVSLLVELIDYFDAKLMC